MTTLNDKNVLAELTHKAKWVLREEGLASFVKRAFRRIFRRPALRWQIVIAIDFSKDIFSSVAKIPVHFEELSPDDFDQMATHYQSRGVSADQLKARLDKGERCFVIKSEDKIVSLFWAQFGRAYGQLLERYYALSPEEIYAYDSYTDPAYRGLGLSTSVPSLAAQPFLKDGYRWLIGFIVPTNQPAKRAVRKRASEVVGYTGYVELFGIRWYFHRTRKILQNLDRTCYFQKF